MKVIYFTDGSRPYGGFTASYTSSEDAGNTGCYKYTYVADARAAMANSRAIYFHLSDPSYS